MMQTRCRIKKKLILVATAVAAALLVTGCAGENAAPGENSRAEQSQSTAENGREQAAANAQSAEEPQASGAEPSVQTQGTAAELGSLKEFTAGTLDGDTFTQDNFADKDITLINFWAVTCGPCIVEMPDLAEFAKALPENVQVMTICLDGYGNEETVEKILADAGFEGVTLTSGSGDIGYVCGNIMYTPTTVLVDSEGNLVGDAIIGGQKDLSGTFLSAVNNALKNAGKEEIRLAE